MNGAKIDETYTSSIGIHVIVRLRWVDFGEEETSLQYF